MRVARATSTDRIRSGGGQPVCIYTVLGAWRTCVVIDSETTSTVEVLTFPDRSVEGSAHRRRGIERVQTVLIKVPLRLVYGTISSYPCRGRITDAVADVEEITECVTMTAAERSSLRRGIHAVRVDYGSGP